jgi:two-component system, cell cycle sensor histidine kinase and response regulator CckA
MSKSPPIRILFVEDLPTDVELAERELKREGLQYELKHVETKENYLRALETFIPDIVISDYSMPNFDGMQALELASKHDPSLPVIILTGSMNEETAVECMKAGASDYVIKEHIKRLPFAVREVLNKRRTRIEKEETQRALGESESLFKTMFNAMVDAALILDWDGTILFANKAASKIVSFESVDQLIGMSVFDFIVPEAEELVLNDLKQVREGKGGFLHDYRIQLPLGDERWMEGLGTLVRFKGREADFITLRDVTERKRAEEVLRKRTYDLNERVKELRCIYDISKLIEQTDKPLDEILRESVPLIVRSVKYPDIACARITYHDKQFTTSPFEETTWKLGTELVINDRPVGSIDVFYLAERDEEQYGPFLEEEIRLLEAVADHLEYCIERRRIEEERERLSTLLNDTQKISKLGGWEYDMESGKITWTDEVYRIYGVDRSYDPSIVANDVSFYAGEGAQIINDAFRRAIEEGKPFDLELEFDKANGQRIWVRTIGKPVFENGKQVRIVGNLMDITERKHADIALRKSEEKYRKFFEEDLTADLVTTPDGKILDCNPEFIRLFGFASHDEALAINATDLYVLPEKRDELMGLLKKDKKIDHIELMFRGKGKDIIYLIANLTGQFNDRGELEYIYTYLFDITDRKDLEQQFFQTQKLESVGQLAGGVAHDLNNVLGAILGHADIGRRKITPEHPLYERFTKILELTERGSGITRQLLAFSRQQAIEPKNINLNTSLSTLFKLLWKTLGDHIIVTFKPAADLWTVYVDPGQIDQVIMNLSINARDAMPGGGNLVITTRNIEIDQDFVRHHINAKIGKFVLISVSDSGTGIEPDHIDRIFDPFFTTKEMGKGTGLGLSVVHGIVGQHKGFVTVYSEINIGTTFNVYLPAVDTEPDRVVSTVQREIPTGSGKILVAEDDEGILSMITTVLEHQGYSIIPARNGRDAFNNFEKHADTIDMVVSDVVMPLISGKELYERIQKLRPETKYLFISGYTADIIDKHFIMKEGVDFIPKPFSPLEFGEKIAQILKR